MADTATLDATAPKTQAPRTGIHQSQNATETVDRLLRTIEDIDALAEEGFRNIEVISMLAIKWLETPDAHCRHRVGDKTLYTVLGLLKAQAESYVNLIGCHAEEFGVDQRAAQLRALREAAQSAMAA